mmetsp:Transcript_21203/g.49774  ORF Transcript_21203/g.49774 Transcript_21203/m.49774 type:complete len:98 (-) Transcript_21203:89-382(-)
MLVNAVPVTRCIDRAVSVAFAALYSAFGSVTPPPPPARACAPLCVSLISLFCLGQIYTPWLLLARGCRNTPLSLYFISSAQACASDWDKVSFSLLGC